MDRFHSWYKREKEDFFDPYSVYEFDSLWFTVKLHHGGRIKGDVYKSYEGGEVDYFDNCNADYFSLHDINWMVESCGHKDTMLLYYLDPVSDISHGLFELQIDKDVLKICEWINRFKIIEVYCDHMSMDEILELEKKREVVPPKKSNVIIEEIEIENEHENVATGRIRKERRKLLSLAWKEPENHAGLDVTQDDLVGGDGDEAMHSSPMMINTNNEGIEYTMTENATLLNVGHQEAARSHENVTVCDDFMDWGYDVLSHEEPTIQQEERDDVDPSTEMNHEYVDESVDRTRNEEITRTKKKSKKGATAERQRKGKSVRLETEAIGSERGGEPNASTENDLQRNPLLDDYFEEMINDDSGSSDDEGGASVRYKTFTPNLKLGQRFASKSAFRKILRTYGILNGKDIYIQKSDRTRIRAKCRSESCNWYVYASIDSKEKSRDFVVKAMCNEHTNCSHAWKNKNMTAQWAAERLEESIRSNMKMPVTQFIQTIDDMYNCTISRHSAYKAISFAKANIRGSTTEQYALLGRYAAELERTHPHTTTEIMFGPRSSPESKPKFMRFYCCLGPLKQGFKDGCRPLIALDGCHCKGPYPGQLLTAIGIDPNNGWWPIAWALVEKEARVQWHWFLELLIADLDIPDTSAEYTFISDQQKGLDSALLELLPYVGHRYCVQHMYRNFKKKNKGDVELQIKFWNIAKATTREGHEEAVKDLKECDMEAFKWVDRAAPPESWCKAFFPLNVKSDMLVNNHSESFNGQILPARELPVISLFEWIRVYLMEQAANRVEWMEKCTGKVGPAIKAMLNEREKLARHWKTLSNGRGGFQVRGPKGEQYVVFLNDKTCSCRLWEISGLPCCHAVAAILKIGGNPCDYAHPCYSKDLFLKIYSNVLNPINGKSLWPQSDIPELDPPLVCTQPGRPKKKRKRDGTEVRNKRVGDNNVQKLRKNVVVHCRHCGVAGHNVSTCKNAGVTNKYDKKGTRIPATATPTNEIHVQAGIVPSTSARQTSMPKKRGKNLSEQDKVRENVNAEYLGNEPPYKIGRWSSKRSKKGAK